ncbi:MULTISPECIES: S8 family serine peptidase [Virgibacillus]|uniref:S8 family serine peptidase n=1 Tax=Virgibacillus TaxID=84406 RepID=UPI00067AC092|nr:MULTISPECIES: S8 family serine peptidase [Virgibacillus]MBS7426823.1 S8 family serine peptidase [Virgibacillus sp. 19R1-5]MED3739358.1 S8 family serine peptidase [Virgibacillus pantothenticus]QTY17533.1 S8 family serine peptidase [Virgibacillus pantothenticus]SIT15596.1 minor extracellular protease Epr [Virgibacillus pantothenticus]
MKKKVYVGFSLILFLSLFIYYLQVFEKEEEYESWALDYIGEARKQSSSQIKIAILDSGINKTHGDLKNVNFEEVNVIEPNKPITDKFGHGTAIAGIIAGEKVGIISSEENLILYDVKVLNDKGEGTIEDIINGIMWCVEQEVDVINISFGFFDDKKGLHDAIRAATKKGIVVTAAAGNTMGLSVDYPAKYEEVLSIASIDKDFNIDPRSGYGKVDYSAPGVKVISTDNQGGMSEFSGTSFATAYATGVIASIVSNKYNTANIKQLLNKHTLKLNEKSVYGEGILTFKREYLEETYEKVYN